jgi:hypothetical protein
VVTTLASYSGGPGLKSLPEDPAILIAFFRDFTQSLQAHSRTVPYIRRWQLPSKFFPIHHSLTTPSLDAM